MSTYAIQGKTLENIATAIKEKLETAESIKVSEFPTKIAAIEKGGSAGLPEELLHFDDARYLLSSNGGVGAFHFWQKYFPATKEQTKTLTQSATNMNRMNYTSDNIPNLQMDITARNGGHSLSQMFWDNYQFDYSGITIDVDTVTSASSFMENSRWAFNTPKVTFDSLGQGDYSSIFNGCMNLRQIDSDTYRLFMARPASYNQAYVYQGFRNCYQLMGLNNLPFPNPITPQSNNMFYSTFENCSQLHSLVFAPATTQCTNQTIDLSYYVGYWNKYNTSQHLGESNMTDEERAKFEHQILKGSYSSWNDYVTYGRDARYYTTSEARSKYAKDEATETVNSLPEYVGSATTTGNVIKFKGNAGLDDLLPVRNRAINTMDEEVIAAAAAKGWTVSFV